MMSWKTCKTQLSIALLLAAAATQAAAADPVLSVLASKNPAVKGSTVELDVSIAGVADLFSYQFSFSFNPAVLQATGAGAGSFLGADAYADGGKIEPALGSITYTFGTLLGDRPGISGSGKLAHFSFNVIGTGVSALTFSDVIFLDSHNADLALQIQPQSLLAVPEPETYLMLGVGLVGLAALRRRQLKQPGA
ncbi:PEP-CTERM sorting domain-containing protein [Rugamonas sp. CCM 8940]|uniref:cohesin domain-containing protein n=1 Tax=Rugamonas sp. CCM 8940 TaxID=2765359 RepID=UPI0018F2CDF2|nr:cohesin domain-containing protein [Rugamonas sp. CCM 8940]MBJ7312882.1 PEP-CTERM sorting domain-containing protein [Rugamonas sp. CCM 8940]